MTAVNSKTASGVEERDFIRDRSRKSGKYFRYVTLVDYSRGENIGRNLPRGNIGGGSHGGEMLANSRASLSLSLSLSL